MFDQALNELLFICAARLNGYINSPAYHNLEEKLDQSYYVEWNVGVGPTACFTRAISSITRDVNIRKHGRFDHVIEVDMKQAAAVLGNRFNINDMLHIKVAEQLGLLEHKYDMVDDAELRYYTYDMEKKYLLSLRHHAAYSPQFQY